MKNMNNTQKVNEFLDKLNHPLKLEMVTVRNIIVKAHPQIEEDVKWGGPSFRYKDDLATFNPRIKNYVAVIFHKGSLLKGKTGFLEEADKGKAYAKFHNMNEVEMHKAELEKVVNEWVKLMDSQK